MLFLKDIVPGQEIACRDFAERLGMSPTPEIQALKWLEFQSLVQHIPNRSHYASPFSLKEAQEIFELRELLSFRSRFLNQVLITRPTNCMNRYYFCTATRRI